jgi:translation initiation factor 1 (eIF-1/SUI1)
VGKAANVVINEDKPRKGAFVVTVSGVKEPIVELLDLKRPFGPLKALDMEEVVQNVLQNL